jgi:hypothetical protein
MRRTIVSCTNNVASEKSRKRASSFSKREEDATEALEAPEKAFDFIALAIHGFVVFLN